MNEFPVGRQHLAWLFIFVCATGKRVLTDNTFRQRPIRFAFICQMQNDYENTVYRVFNNYDCRAGRN